MQLSNAANPAVMSDILRIKRGNQVQSLRIIIEDESVPIS